MNIVRKVENTKNHFIAADNKGNEVIIIVCENQDTEEQE